SSSFLHEFLAVIVFIILVLARHAQHVKIGKTILVQIAKRRITTPAAMFQTHFLRNVPEFSPAQVLVENALFAAGRETPALKRIPASQIETTAAFVVRGINAHVRQEQVQQAVIVKIKKHRAGGMAGGAAARAKTGFQSDVLELSLA